MSFVFYFILNDSLSHLIAHIMMLSIYKANHPFFEKYKVLKNTLWPWQENYKLWRKLLSKVIKTALEAHLIVLPIFLIIDVQTGIKLRFDIESFPSHLEVISQLLFFMIFEDFVFYWVHRLLHHPFFYKNIHKGHHEFVEPISCSSLYAHHLEFIITNIIPTGIGFKILGKKTHFATLLIWIIMRIFEAMDGHCGYEFSFSPFRFCFIINNKKKSIFFLFIVFYSIFNLFLNFNSN